MVALLLRLDVGGVTLFIDITVQAPRCLIMTIYKHRITVQYSQSQEKYCQTGVCSDSYTRKPTTSYEETDWLVCVPSLSRLFPIQDGCVQPNRVLRRVWGPEDFIPFNPCVWHNFICTTAELHNAPLAHFV